MKKHALAIAAISTVAAFGVNAQSNKSYFEVGVVNAKYDESPFYFTSPVAFFKWGVQINDTLATELQLGRSIQDANFVAYNTSVKASFDSMIGGYLVGNVPLDNKASLFGRVGFVKGQVSISTAYGSASDGDSGLSYGVGARFNLDKSNYLSIDYTSFYKKTGVSITGPSLSFGSTF